MSSTSDIDRVIAKTEGQISRLEAMERSGLASRPLLKRMAGHLAKHGNFLGPALMAGCVFSVAWSQMQQKYRYEREIASRNDQLDTLHAEKQRLLDRVGLLEVTQQEMRDGVLRELDAGGLRLAPTAERLRKVVSSEHRTSASEADTSATQLHGLKHQTEQAPHDSQSRLMI